MVYGFGASAGDGRGPIASLTVYQGALFGTTGSGGASGNGTVFKLQP